MATQSQQIQSEPASGPPLPRVFYRVVNPIMTAILRSPLHGMLSKSLMLLIYDGRKSGKRYVIPVGYTRRGGQIFVFTHSAWWKNFIGGAPVALRLGGKLVRGTATPVDDPDLIRHVIGQMVAERGEAMAERMGMLRPDTPQAAASKHGMVFIQIDVEEAAQ